MLEINKIYNEDCLVGMQKIDDKSIDCIICDLPYGTTACKWDTIIPLSDLWKQYMRIIKDDGAIVLFGQEPFSSRLRMSNLEMYRYDWIWEKQKPSNFQLMNFQCGRVHELISIFSKSNACYSNGKTTMKYNPQKIKMDKPRFEKNVKICGNKTKNILHNYNGVKKDVTYYEKLPTSILHFNTVQKNKKHPTQKPVDLIEYLICTYTNQDDIVLDNCIGSGTTAIACLRTKRNFIGFEINHDYCEIANNRILEEIGQNNES